MCPTAKGMHIVRGWLWLFAIFFVLFLPKTALGCSGRKVFHETWGIITDGTGKYPASAHCEWLIIGKLRN